MKISVFIFFFSLFTLAASSQISRPEKWWAITHPFVAKKALEITRRVQKTVDSIKVSGIIGNDNLGGRFDAFKHAYWMASVSLGIGSKKALKLGRVMCLFILRLIHSLLNVMLMYSYIFLWILCVAVIMMPRNRCISLS